MKLLCIALVTSVATVAHAQQPGMRFLPPIEFDRPHTGPLTITRVTTEEELRKHCTQPMQIPLACAKTYPDKCEIIMMTDEIMRAAGWDPALALRHEIGHCNGWPPDHERGRALSDPSLSIELNSVENAGNRCRVNFVIANKSNVAMERMNLDVVAFSVDATILRRLLIEMGPVRAAKTMVRTFVFDDECRQIGAVLVNGVAACAPGEPGACLDGLTLSSRLKALRLYK